MRFLDQLTLEFSRPQCKVLGWIRAQGFEEGWLSYDNFWNVNIINEYLIKKFNCKLIVKNENFYGIQFQQEKDVTLFLLTCKPANED